MSGPQKTIDMIMGQIEEMRETIGNVVSLVTGEEKSMVAQFKILPLEIPYEVMVWGERIFAFVERKENGDMTYKEVFAFYLFVPQTANRLIVPG